MFQLKNEWKRLKTASLKINLRWQVVNWQPQWKKIWLIFFCFFSIIYYFVHRFFKKPLRCMAKWAKPFYQGGTELPRCLIISPRSDMYLNASLTIYHLHLTDVMYNRWMSCGFLYLIKYGPPIRFVRYSQKTKSAPFFNSILFGLPNQEVLKDMDGVSIQYLFILSWRSVQNCWT